MFIVADLVSLTFSNYSFRNTIRVSNSLDTNQARQFAESYLGPNCLQLNVDWLQSLKQFFINVSYHILVSSLTLMALFLSFSVLSLKQSQSKNKFSYKYMVLHIVEKLF